MKHYIGITIGPVFRTIEDASSPAALWFASSAFSDLTRRLCDEILSGEDCFEDAVIYSPHYGQDIDLSDGVGKFHDQVIFSTDNFSEVKMEKIIKKTKEGTGSIFPAYIVDDKTKAFLDSYLRILYVKLPESMVAGQNCLLALAPYLNALEIMVEFPESDFDSPFRKLFMGTEDYRNKYVKGSPLFKKIVNPKGDFLNEENNFRNIEDIASVSLKNTELKPQDYFAVVYADGDSITNVLKQLPLSASIKDFSRGCFAYAESASNLIKSFGGMCIYAGGDDLLFLAPVIGKRQQNIFSLCNEISGILTEKLQNAGVHVSATVSFGISIQYYKYPLYEALDRSLSLLNTAKREPKNNMAVLVEKHSGQLTGIVISNNDYSEVEKLISIIGQKGEKAATSVIYTIEKNKVVLSLLLENYIAKVQAVSGDEMNLENVRKSFLEVWGNFFDNPDQGSMKAYIDKLGAWIFDNMISYPIQLQALDYGNNPDNQGIKPVDTEDRIVKLSSTMRLAKFLTEKRGER